MLKKLYLNKCNKGMTLIELLVVISIFMVLSGIIMFNYGKFRSSTSVQNLADDIALSVRKAQGYAIGVHGDNSLFNSGYGIHITANTIISNPSAGSNKSFIIFRDLNNDGKYNKDSSTTCGTPTASNECLEVLSIIGDSTIRTINLHFSGGSSNAGGGSIDAVFKRPNPEPTFCYKNNQSDSSCSYGSTISFVDITVGDGNGNFKTITIYNNGQISTS